MGFAQVSSDLYLRWYDPDSPDGLDQGHIDWCLNCMRQYGYDRAVFYDRTDRITMEEWRAFVAAPSRWFFCSFDSEARQTVAFWLDSPTRTFRQSFYHFSLLVPPDSFDAPTAGRKAARWLFETTKLRQLIGVTPAVFRHALDIAYATGFRFAARLDKAIMVRGRERDAILTILDRRDV
jgi:hypothetical protein